MSSFQQSSGQSTGVTAGQSTGNSSGSNQSTSTIPEQDPQIGFLTDFGNVAESLGAQQYDWAQDQFANNSDLTDNNVNDYLQNSDMASQNAQRDTQNYNDIFNPAAGSLTDDWQSYTSPDRVASEMGRAEADVGQNFDAQRKNIEQNLNSFGINPSDPRYAGQMAANRTAQAASEAGAGTQARLNTEATGRQLRSEALGVAQMLPGQSATEQNVSMQGDTGAENAMLANTSTGALTEGTAPGYLNSGIADVKFSPLGTTSSGQTASGQQSTNNGQNQSTQQSSGASTSPSPGGSSSSSRPGSGSSNRSGGGNTAGDTGGGTSWSGMEPNTSAFGINANSTAGTNGSPGGSSNPSSPNYNPSAPYNVNDGESMADWRAGGASPGPGWGTGDPTAPPPITNDTTPMPPGETSMGDPSGGDPTGDFAAGGAIPDDMSPSGGQQVDDVPATIQQSGGKAQLNAGEFVVPQDVVQWHGHKFFQDLIAKSRKARQTNPGPAHPSMQGGMMHHADGGQVQPGSSAGGDPPNMGSATQGTGGIPEGLGDVTPQSPLNRPTQVNTPGVNTQNSLMGRSAPAPRPLATMRNYQMGNRSQGFAPQRQYFQRTTPAQRQPAKPQTPLQPQTQPVGPTNPTQQPQTQGIPTTPAGWTRTSSGAYQQSARPTDPNQQKYWDAGDQNWQRDSMFGSSGAPADPNAARYAAIGWSQASDGKYLPNDLKANYERSILPPTAEQNLNFILGGGHQNDTGWH